MINQAQELEPFLMSTALLEQTEHVAVGSIEGGEQGGRPIPVMRPEPRLNLLRIEPAGSSSLQLVRRDGIGGNLWKVDDRMKTRTRTRDVRLGSCSMGLSTQNQAFRAGHLGQNVALAALIEHTIEHNFSVSCFRMTLTSPLWASCA